MKRRTVDLGERFVRACHRLKLTPGKPFRMHSFYERIAREVFGTLNEDGLRTARRVTIGTGKKNGKTTHLAAWICVLLLVDYEDDAEIYSIASSLGQAAHLYKQARKFLERSGFADPRDPYVTFNDQFKRIIVVKGPAKGNQYQALSSETTTVHGVVPSVVLVDEAVFVSGDLWQALEGSMGTRREPLVISISHADRTDRENYYQQQLAMARQIRDGVIEIPWWKVYLCELDKGDDWREEHTWFKANPTLGEIKSLDEMRRLFSEAVRTPSRSTRFRQWQLNQFTESAETWLHAKDWDACATRLPRDEFRERLRGRRCFVGVDLSSVKDLTAVVALFPAVGDERGPQVLTAFFCPEDSIEARSEEDGVPYRPWADEGYITPTPGNVVDYDAVRALIKEWAEEFVVVQLGYDRRFATDVVTRLSAHDGIECVPVGQGYADLSSPTKSPEKRVISSTIEHDQNPVMNWCVQNTVVDRDAVDNIKPAKDRSNGRIDGVAALVDAIFCYDRQPEPTDTEIDSTIPFFV